MANELNEVQRQELFLLRNLDNLTRGLLADPTDTPTKIAIEHTFEELDALREGDVEFPELVYLNVYGKLERRRLIGLDTYGMKIMASPETMKQWLEHALEESLDQSVYLQTVLLKLED
jgi:hypothetical protein